LSTTEIAKFDYNRYGKRREQQCGINIKRKKIGGPMKCDHREKIKTLLKQVILWM
jgi:hypothetical protein